MTRKADPPEHRFAPGPVDLEELGHLAAVLRDADGPVSLLAPGGEAVALTPSLREVLRTAISHHARGEAFLLLPDRVMLSTNEAAKFLGISRPHLLKLLDGGQLPFESVGAHRRVAHQDLVAFRKHQRHGHIKKEETTLLAIHFDNTPVHGVEKGPAYSYLPGTILRPPSGGEKLQDLRVLLLSNRERPVDLDELAGKTVELTANIENPIYDRDNSLRFLPIANPDPARVLDEKESRALRTQLMLRQLETLGRRGARSLDDHLDDLDHERALIRRYARAVAGVPESDDPESASDSWMSDPLIAWSPDQDMSEQDRDSIGWGKD